MKSDRFGINIKQFCRDHETFIQKHLDADDPKELEQYHLMKLGWLQHERLIHLQVMIMSVMIELGIVYIVLSLPETWPYSAYFMLGWMILVIAYIQHYFFLENTVQHWYVIAEMLHERTKGKKNTD